MKTKLIFGAALLFSAAAFAQSPTADKQRHNTHGTEVSTVAKSEMEAGTKGEAVSATASAKSQATVKAGENTPETRAQRKAERDANREARKQEKDFVADIKADAEARKQEGTDVAADVKADVEARKALLKETREEAKAAREAAKADRKASSGDDLLDADAKVKVEKSERKPAKANHPAKVRGGVKAGTDVQISRPKVGAKVRGTAGLGIL